MSGEKRIYKHEHRVTSIRKLRPYFNYRCDKYITISKSRNLANMNRTMFVIMVDNKELFSFGRLVRLGI